jgi:hypothetical protein
MATGRIPTTANSPLTVKGDLFGYSTTQARVPVGNDGETLVADSSTATGLSYQANFAAGKNKIINGDFGVWQRGTSFSNPASAAFTSDRWSVVWDGSGATRTISRETFTPATAPVAGYEYPYFYRYAQSVAGSGANYNLFQTRLEDVRTFAGQTVTISFWGKAAATTSIVKLNLEQEFGTGGSPSATVSTDIASTDFSLTTSWQRFTVTTTVPSISGKTIGTTTPGFLGLRVWIPVNATFTLDFFGFQIESGSVATAFQTATGTLQGELAACQRYYQRLVAANNSSQMAIGPAWAFNANGADMVYKLTTEMRVAPTTLDYSSLSHFQWQGISVSNTPATIAYDTNINSRYNAGVTFAKTSGYTSGGNYFILVNSSDAYIGFGAEL